MKPYPSYKDSGIEWIGDIPEHWEVKKLKWLIDEPLKYGANESAISDDPNNPRYIRITDFGDDGKLRQNTFRSLPYSVAKNYLLEEGDLLFARSGATVGKTFQFKEYNGLACYAGYLIKAKPDENKLLSDYLYCYTKSSIYENWKNSVFIQATIQNIGADKYKELPIILPTNVKEQAAIADFLDHKTAQIDQSIEKGEELIRLLKEHRAALIHEAVTRGLDDSAPMKDSGLTGIGKIPAHWEVKKLKYLSSIMTGDKNTEDKEKEGEYPFFVRSQTVENISTYSYDGEAILTAGDGVGVAKVFHYVNGKFDYHQRVYKISDFNDVLGKYVFFYMKSNFYNEVIKLSAKSTVDSLRMYMLKDFPVVFGSINEQRQIIEYIETETARIDAEIGAAEREIRLLKEYRQALISEAVTGKIDVREVSLE